jgi:hypothetical protein
MKEDKMLHTSMLLLALAGTATPSEVAKEGPTWHRDYAKARQVGARAEKPLAVVLGTGESGWKDLGRDGGLGEKARQLLADKYVCVYIDTSTKAGERLARDFEIPGGKGLVLSDRTGELQAFAHEGDLANADLVRHLQKYADPNHVVRTTETNPARVSYYSPATTAPATTQPYYPSAQPAFYPSFGGGFGVALAVASAAAGAAAEGGN